jgi:hypothetical protein
MWSLIRIDGSQKKVPVDYCTHNHLLMDPKSYYQHRALSDEQLATIKARRAARISVNRLKSIIRTTDPLSKVKARDIQNATAELTRAALERLLPNKAFIQKLTKLKEEGEVYFAIELSEKGRIEKVFIAVTREA